MARLAQLTLDVHDAEVMGGFWSAALAMRVQYGGDGSAKLYPPSSAPEPACTIWLQHVDEPKHDKLRLHFDLRPDGDSVEDEVERLIALGARHVDVGQSAADPFVVLADPEGNEFCVLRREPRAV